VVRFTVSEPIRGASEAAASSAGGHSVAEVLRHLWSLRSFRHLSLAAALYAFAGYGFMTWAPTFLIRIYGMNTGDAGFWSGLIVGGGSAVGTLLGGVFADRLSVRDIRWMMRLPALSAVLAVPFTCAFLFWPDRTGALFFYFPAVVLAIFYAGPTFAMAQSLARLRMRALASAVILFIINLIGLGLGPQTVGILNDLFAESAGDDAIRYSLLCVTAVNFWAVAHSLRGARTLRADLDRVREEEARGSS
jgi:MFS family permease